MLAQPVAPPLEDHDLGNICELFRAMVVFIPAVGLARMPGLALE